MRPALLVLFSAAAALAQAPAGPIEQTRPKTAPSDIPVRFYDGYLVSMEPHQVEIETLSQRRVVCKLTADTNYTTFPSEFAPGDRIGVTTASQLEDDCVAEWVGRPEERFVERRKLPAITTRLPTGELMEELPLVEHDDPLVRKAVAANLAFSDHLPDFACHQTTTRSESRNLGKKWKDTDVVEADVILYRGKEDYQNITVDGVPHRGKMEQIGYIWSTGEYGAILQNLFHEYTRAEFKLAGASQTIRGREAIPYSYHVPLEYSNWMLNFNKQRYLPEYSGRVWLEAETGRALRIELEALNLPWEYPVIAAEASIDYDEVMIGDQKYLMPVESMNMGCQRGSARCFRNRIEFRDYRKFTAESTMFQTDSDISFGDDEPNPQ